MLLGLTTVVPSITMLTRLAHMSRRTGAQVVNRTHAIARHMSSSISSGSQALEVNRFEFHSLLMAYSMKLSAVGVV